MTMRHFFALELIVAALLRDHEFTPEQQTAIEQSLSDFCASMNPRFNRIKWLEEIKRKA